MSRAEEQLSKLFNEKYSFKNICFKEFDEFWAGLEQIEKYSSTSSFMDNSKQRDLSIKYFWGHNHDFQNGKAKEGMMKNRHIEVVSHFVEEHGLPTDLTGKKVLDIGVWTGGTSLLLVAMGAEVVAIEEVEMYADTVNFLAEAYGVDDRLKCYSKSLYEFLHRFSDDFDYILYSGVIYHVTDPVLSLRLVFNALKDGGVAYVETLGNKKKASVCLYEGAPVIRSGSKEDMNRTGWNYYIPSLTCKETWCYEAGFDEVKANHWGNGRICTSAKRLGHKDICRAGLSLPNIR